MNYRNFLYILLVFFLASCAKEPIASFTADKTVVEVGETVTFTNTSTEATSYQWDFGDGASSTSDSPTHAYTSEGSFNVELTATGDGGSNSASTTISVAYPDPVAGFTVDKTTADVDELITFTNTSEDADSYSWTFGDGETSTDVNPTHIYTEDGTFTVQLTANGPGGGSSTATETLTIEMPPPVAAFEMDRSKAEPGELITFTNTSLYAETYSWDFGDGATSTVTDPTHSYAAEGIYTVQLTATGTGGTHTVSEVVSIGPAPVAAFSMDNDSPGTGETVTFMNESTNATSYLWDFGDGSTSTNENPTYAFSAEGIYSVQLIATGLGGIDSVSHDVTVAAVNILPGEGVRDIVLEETWGDIKPKLGDWEYLGNFTQPASGGGYYVIHVSKSNTYGLWIYMVSVTGSTTLEDEDVCFQVNCLDTFVGQTAEGIKIGSTETEVEAAYGPAEDIDYDNDIWWYDSLGMNLRFDNSEADMIGIFPAGKKKHTGFIQDLLDNLHQIQPATRF